MIRINKYTERVVQFHTGGYPRIVGLANIGGDNRLDIVCIDQPGEFSDGAIIVMARYLRGM